MGQKVNPYLMRLSLTKGWRSKWFSRGAEFVKNLKEDLLIKELIGKKLGKNAGIGLVEIKRGNGGHITITIHTSKPGIIIGRSGQGVVDLKNALDEKIRTLNAEKPQQSKKQKGKKPEGKIKIDIVEIKNADLWASLVAQNIANQLERRIAYRKAVKQAMEKVMQAKAKGVKINVSGRLGGAEIARKEKFSTGSIPLSTLRAEIDYAYAQALTTYGTIGVKVWIAKKNE